MTRSPNAEEAMHEYGVTLTAWDDLPKAAAVVYAVAHSEFVNRPIPEFVAKMRPGAVLTDVKCQADAAAFQKHGVTVWRL
jgi:UDP-N-acetyl-D-glucosamine/UDP-N-acetyl-D-galactosamine dehydrogenase